MEPGSYKAVLTLASGEQVNLEEWCRDSLWKDGTLIRKRKGELTYEQKAGDMQQEEMLFNTITIPRSGEYKLVLSDGTKGWLRKYQLLSGISGIMLILGLGILIYHPSGNLQITCLDIGQGDCISIQLPQGQNFLIDGGSSNKKNIAHYQILPFLKNRGIGVIDAILISHTDNDHISGVLELFDYMRTHLTSVRVKNLILPEWTQPDDAYQQLVDKAQAAGVNVQKGRKGEQIALGKASLRFLSPDRGTAGTDANEDGMVVELTYGGFEGLFTGDIGTETEEKLLPELEDVDFLKVGHHGSRYSTCQEFLDVVRPELAVVSCSATNTYGHPSGETIERLEDSGAKIWYTMKEGAVTAETDGKEVWVDTFVHP